jgi:hypothetical protein
MSNKKQMEKMKNNILIAEFMGLYKHHQDSSFMIKKTPQGNKTIDVKSLYYHCSWDWLMVVTNEIIKTRDEKNADWDLTNLKYSLQTTNIELVYNSVVEFINYFNSLKNEY